MYNRYVLLAMILWFLPEESSPVGLVYRTGCCYRSEEVPDYAKKTVDFIEKFGFIAENHEILTEDGYIISLHRIQGHQFASPYDTQPAVIIQHGIAASSVLWLLSQEKSFPFLLADEGFDVWLVDTRGNSYSNKHAFLSTSNPKYWRFSFHEQAVYDLAAATDYVLNITGNEKLFYVGHSRGTTMAFALLSTKPEYNNKFHLVSMFAPVAYIRHAKPRLLRLIFEDPLSIKLQDIIKTLGAYVVPGSSDASIQFREIICNRTQLSCMNLIFSFSGFDYELLNQTMIPIYLSHYPEGGAIQEYLHYLQIGNTDQFRQFDYGPETNLVIYGTRLPPLYKLSQITAPISVHHGDNDFLVRPQDLNRLMGELKSVVANHRVPFDKFSHSDFLWATKADVYVYRPTIELMKQRLALSFP